MRISFWFIAAFGTSALFTLSFPVRALSQGEPIAGFVEEVRGGANLRKGELKVKLDPKRDLRRALHPGEVVWTDHGGYLRLRLCSNLADKNCKPKEITSTSEFRIEARPPAQTDDERKHQEAAQELGRSGGRAMGVLSPFFSPAPDSAVRPSTLVLRWIRSRELSSFLVSIRDQSHQRLWEKKIANGGAGSLDSNELKQILTRFRDQHTKGLLILEVEDKNLIGSQARFSLLTALDEKNLQQELAEWDQETDVLMRHLGRAHAFFLKDMFTEVAEEFEAALWETPDSRDLLLRTIQAHRDTGNIARAEILKRRLASR